MIIEEGPSLAQNSAEAFSLSEINQKYRNGGLTFAFGHPRVTYAEGRCVGGGSEINAGLYHRTPPEILEKWRREFSVEGLEPTIMEHCFAESERQLGLSSIESHFDFVSQKLASGAERLGVGCVELPMFARVSAPGGGSRVVRRPMSQSYLPRAIMAGAKLHANARALSILRTGNKWRVRCQVKDKKEIAIYAENVFIAAGAVQTPALLRRSGFTQNIGNSLQMHPSLKVLAEFDHEINSPEMLVAPAQVKDRHAHLSFGCSVSSPPHLALAQFNSCESSDRLRESWRRSALYYVSLSDGMSRGVVRVIPGLRDSVLRYRLEPDDLRRLTGGLGRLSQIVKEAGAIRVSSAAKDVGLMSAHLFSSCPMGENKEICATDSFGRIHDQQGLFIADASLLCSAPGVNPQGSIMAIAHRNALHYLGKV
jgi:choline dehydrogenase-like flavoprotein